MQYNQAIFKIGGKILENSKNIESTVSQLTQLYEKNVLQKIILIPGGGSYANFIRKIDEELKLGDDLAHWMAVYSMNYNGIELNRKYPNLECIEELNTFQDAQKIFCVFLPYNYLRNNDTLPHSWDVTSDSIALYVANELNLNQCFLIKDVEGIYSINKELIKKITTLQYGELKRSGRLAEIGLNQDNLKKSKPIDSYLLTLIDKYKISCILLNGALQKSRILKYFKNVEMENQVYTKIN
ncbi:MAG: amino acid kinase family protein, partial [Promethearchaeota archaeon]